MYVLILPPHRLIQEEIESRKNQALMSAGSKKVHLEEVFNSTSEKVGCPFLEITQLEENRALTFLIVERLVCYIFLNMLFSSRELNTSPNHVADYFKLSSMP